MRALTTKLYRKVGSRITRCSTAVAVVQLSLAGHQLGQNAGEDGAGLLSGAAVDVRVLQLELLQGTSVTWSWI